MRRIVFRAGSVVVVALAASCASIMHGVHQEVGISSTPTNATVTVDNKPLGNTPVIANLKRGDNHIVKIELAGYMPFEATLTRKVSGWVWGNVLFGGLIGLGVDALTGGLYNLTPDQISGQLAHQGASATVTKDGIYVVLVTKANPSWQKVGMLQTR